MPDEIRTIDLILSAIGLVLSMLGMVHAVVGRDIEIKTRNFFGLFFSVLLVYVLLIFTRELTYSNSGYGWVFLSRILFFGQAFFVSILPVLITAFLLYLCGEGGWKRNPLFMLSAGLWTVYFILLVVNLFSGFIYRVDDANNYERGPLFPILILPTLAIMTINMIILILRHKSLSTKQIYAFAIYSVVPMLAMAIQAFFFGIHLIAMSTVISALFMHIYIISDQSERLHREEAENAKLKLDILLAQIRPHFLFNTLTGIKHLCGKDPVRAEEAIDQLTKYLRHNMDSLTADIPIPFERELEHVKQYINIQKIRFGDELTVDYDIEYSDFSMPTLTLQPLVENAVTYGIRRSESGTGKVTILTYKSGKMIRIIVEDDGCGFDVNSLYDDTDRSHVGISNVRERIRSISNGTLEIESAPGHGTRVIITIPDIE